MAFTPSSHAGILHHYTNDLVAFEHTFPDRTPPRNTLLFTAGLSEGLLSPPYITTLAKLLPPGWCLVQTLLSSSYKGWATSSLRQDAIETAECVRYLRQLRSDGKLVLMGHSTGCQATMHYLTGPDYQIRPPVDGAVLQAPVSDREAGEALLPRDLLASSVAIATQMVANGRGEDVMPSAATGGCLGTAPSAQRWLSLASPAHDGEDDLFSSDLSDAQLRQTFGSLPPTTPLCILYSGADQFVPAHVDKQALVERWKASVRAGAGIVDEAHSAVVPGASHNGSASPAGALDDLLRRVVGFLERVEGGEAKWGVM
ncbi:MAG: hypothetical protein M1832_003359 [Thelocarpon impressellum]|nr:MAG: hypothetical protein M1832_003359 [Thelocarpon impressellum]